jgi:hypothetical protein
MPVDLPKAGESKEKYLEYCIPAEIKAGMEAPQATAVCISVYERTKMKSITDTTSKVMAKVSYDTKFRGINLGQILPNGDYEFENGLEDACLDGWKALGTKILDGRTVPNCIPEEDHPDFRD